MLLDIQANCQVDKMNPENKKYFEPDTLDQAHLEGYDNCAHCIVRYSRTTYPHSYCVVMIFTPYERQTNYGMLGWFKGFH
ncbi:MAG: hypothetical protein OEL82_11810 [Nitrosopumilus sp.]|nr:hypothetical protein [Nitrosopumilus sp.]